MDLLTIPQKFLKNYSTKLVNVWKNDISAALDHAALRVSVIQWRLDVIKNALTVFLGRPSTGTYVKLMIKVIKQCLI